MSWRDYNDPWVCPICGEHELTDHHGYVHLVEQHPVDDPPKRGDELRDLMQEFRDRAARLEASNPAHQRSVERPESGYPMAVCAEGHDPVKVLFPDECAECGGDDDYGRPFCPICEFCCGC